MDRPIFFKTIVLKGRDGASIGNIKKTATAGTTDTYTITLTDGETYTFQVTNGTSISNISYTSSSGNVDTYTITLTDGSTQTFQVTNGEDFTVPTDGVIYYDGADVPDGYEETSAPSGSGQYATIDDNTASVSTTYSSSKIEQLISGIGGGGVDYAYTEQDTGLKWFDGKPIYQRSIYNTSSEVQNDLTSWNIDSVVDMRVVWSNNTAWAVNNASKIEYDGYWKTLVFTSAGNVIANKAYITVWYTKTTDTV